MSSSKFPPDTVAQAQAVLEAWKKIDPNLTIGDLAPAALVADLAQVQAVQGQISAAAAQLTDLRNQRDAVHVAVWDKVKRLRAGVKGIYGDDSSQYEMVGGTRRSERKKRTPKPPA